MISVLCTRTIYTVFYRPPNGNFKWFFSFVEEFFQCAHNNKHSAVIGGDYNIYMLGDTEVKLSLEILLNSHGYFNIIYAPTRITCHTSTCIDLFITNYPVEDTKAGVFSNALSAHMPVFLSMKRRDKT